MMGLKARRVLGFRRRASHLYFAGPCGVEASIAEGVGGPVA